MKKFLMIAFAAIMLTTSMLIEPVRASSTETENSLSGATFTTAAFQNRRRRYRRWRRRWRRRHRRQM